MQSAGNGAAGDQFSVVVDGNGAVLGIPAFWSDGDGNNGLTPLPGQSDLDAHSFPFWEAAPVFFSIAPGAVATVIQVFPAPAVEIFPPAALDLLAGDNLHAMTAYYPGDIPTLSSWGLLTIVLVLLIIGSIIILRIRFRSIA